MSSKPTRERVARGASALEATTAMCGIGYSANDDGTGRDKKSFQDRHLHPSRR